MGFIGTVAAIYKPKDRYIDFATVTLTRGMAVITRFDIGVDAINLMLGREQFAEIPVGFQFGIELHQI